MFMTSFQCFKNVCHGSFNICAVCVCPSLQDASLECFQKVASGGDFARNARPFRCTEGHDAKICNSMKLSTSDPHCRVHSFASGTAKLLAVPLFIIRSLIRNPAFCLFSFFSIVDGILPIFPPPPGRPDRQAAATMHPTEQMKRQRIRQEKIP